MTAGTGTAEPETVRRPVSPRTVLQIVGALSAVLASEFMASPLRDSPLRGLLPVSALLMLPLDLLPVIMIVTVRSMEPVAGPLNTADVVALVYLARLTAGLGVLRIQVTRSRVALLLFLIWAAVATAIGFGLYTALGRIAVYAAVGVAVTYRPQARTCLLGGVVAFALVDVILYLPSFPERLWGVFVDDPSHAGGLLIAGLIIVATSRLPRALKVSLGGLLLFGILMTLTRSVWFATGVVAIAARLPRRWYIPLLLPPALAVVSLPLVAIVTRQFSLNPYSAELRLRSMSIGLQEFEKGLFFGHGWAFTSAVGEFGLTGANELPMYNLWIYLGVSVGLVGIALFVTFIGFLGQEATRSPVAYLFLTGSLATSSSEMHFYACSLTALLFFLLTPARPDRPAPAGPPAGLPRVGRPSRPPGHTEPRSLAVISSPRSRKTAKVLVIGGAEAGTGTKRPASGS